MPVIVLLTGNDVNPNQSALSDDGFVLIYQGSVHKLLWMFQFLAKIPDSSRIQCGGLHICLSKSILEGDTNLFGTRSGKAV